MPNLTCHARGEISPRFYYSHPENHPVLPKNRASPLPALTPQEHKLTICGTVWSSKSKGPVTVSALIVPQHGQGLSELAPSVAFPQVSYSALSQPPSSAYMRVFQVIHCSLPSKDRISPQAPKAASGYWDCSALAATP